MDHAIVTGNGHRHACGIQLTPKRFTFVTQHIQLRRLDQDDIPLRELSEKTLFDSGTLTPLVQKLEAKGFLNRVSIAEDERVKKVVLTPKARDLQHKIVAFPKQMRCFMSMGDEELDMLRNFSKKLLQDL